MKFNLVDNWRSAPRWVSMWCMAFASSVTGTWLLLPAEYQAMVPQNVVHAGVFAVLIAGIIGRFIKQTPATPIAPGDIGQHSNIGDSTK